MAVSQEEKWYVNVPQDSKGDLPLATFKTTYKSYVIGTFPNTIHSKKASAEQKLNYQN